MTGSLRLDGLSQSLQELLQVGINIGLVLGRTFEPAGAAVGVGNHFRIVEDFITSSSVTTAAP